MPISGEQFLRMLLWRRFIRRDAETAGLSWEDMCQPAFDAIEWLSAHDLLTQEETRELRSLERAYLALHQGSSRSALESLGGLTALRAAITGLPLDDETIHGSYLSDDPVPRFAILPDELHEDDATRRYTHISEQGTGGMGRVLIVHDRHLDRDVALKELLPPSEFDGAPEDSPARHATAMAYRFLQEGMLTAKLEHPAIVPVYELGIRRDGTPYYTMKLVRGRTLAEEIKRCTSTRQRLALLPNFITLCQAIAYAHGKGVIHRDIKPLNVMIGDFGETVVLDWGIAKLKDSDPMDEPEAMARFRNKLEQEFGSETRSLSGQTIGTPGYMSPEQAEGKVDQVDERSDIFSLGALLYELLSGKRAFVADTVAGLLDKTLRENPKSLRQVDPALPPELISICERALQKNPNRRYQRVQDLIKDLHAFQTGAYVASHDYTFRDSLLRFYRRNRAVLHVSAAATLLFLVGISVAFVSVLNARDNERAQRTRAQLAEQEAILNLDAAEQARTKAQFESRLSGIRLLNESVSNGRFGRVQQLLDSDLLDPSAWETRYAAALTHADLSRLQASSSPVFQLEMLPEKNRALTLHNDGIARVWNLETKAPAFESPPSVERLTWGALSPSATHLALVDASGRLLVVDLAQSAVALDTPLSRNPLTSVAFLHDSLVVAASSTGEIWRSTWAPDATPRQLAKLDAAVTKLWAATGASHLVAQCENNRHYGLHPESGQVLFDAPGLFQSAAPDGSLGVAIHAGRMRVIDLQNGALVWESSTDAGIFMKASFTPEGLLIAIALGGQVLVYDPRTGTLLHDWRGGRPIIDAVLDSESKMLTALDLSGYLYWVDLAPKPRVIQRSGGHLRDVIGLRRGSINTVATYGFDGTIREWQLDPVVARLHEEISFDEANQIHSLTSVATSPQLLAASSTGTTTLIDTGTGQIAQVLEAPALPLPFPVAFSSDASRYATALDGFTPAIVQTASASAPLLLHGASGYITGLSISPDNSQLVASDYLGNITLWNLDAPADAAPLLLKCGLDSLLGVAHLGTTGIVAASHDGKLFRFSGATLSLTNQLATTEGSISSMAVALRRGLLALGFKNGVIELRSVETFELLDRAPDTANPIERIFFDSTGTRIFAGGRTSLQLWLVDENVKLHDTAFALPDADSATLVGVQEDLWLQDELGAIPVLRTAAAPTPPATLANERAITAIRSTSEMRQRTADERLLTPGWLADSFPFAVPEFTPGTFWDDWGLKAGDRITRLVPAGAAPMESVAALFDMLSSMPDEDRSIEWEAQRGGYPLRGTLLLKAPKVKRVELTLTPEEAERFEAEFIAPMSTMHERIDEESQRLSASLPGASLPAVWISSPPPSPMRDWLDRMGLNVFDRITGINGQAAISAAQVCDALTAQLQPQVAASPHPVTLIARRGIFQEVHIHLAVISS